MADYYVFNFEEQPESISECGIGTWAWKTNATSFTVQISKIGANAGIVYNADLPGPANRLVWDAANVQEGDNALYRWWSGTRHTFRRNKSSSQRDSSGSQHAGVGVGYGDQTSPNVNFSDLGMPGDSYTDVSGSLGIKAAPGGKPHQKHNSFISSHVTNLWDRASSRRRAMSNGAKSNPPVVLEAYPSMERPPDPRDAAWGADPGPGQDRDGRMSLRRVPSLTSLRKSSFSSSRQSHIPRAAVPVSNVPAPVSILRKPGAANPVPPMPYGPPPVLSPASISTPRMGAPDMPTGNSTGSSHSQHRAAPLPSGIPQPQSSRLPQPSGLPQSSGHAQNFGFPQTSGQPSGLLPQASGLPQPSGLPQSRGRRARPSGIYGVGGGQPVPDLSAFHKAHTRGGSISKSSDEEHGNVSSRSRSRPNQDEKGRGGSASHHVRNLSTATIPSPVAEESPALMGGSRSAIPAPSMSLNTPSTANVSAIPTGDRRTNRFGNDKHADGPATMPPPRQEEVRYSAKPLPPAPAGAAALSRLPSLRSKVPITVSAAPATHVRDHIRKNTITAMPSVVNVELTTPNHTVRQPSAAPAQLPSAMDLFAVSQKLEDIHPATEGHSEHYLRGSELAANNSLGLEEPTPSVQSHTSLAYLHDGMEATDMSRTSSAPFSSVPMSGVDRRSVEPPTTKTTFGGWNTPGSYGPSTPGVEETEFIFPVQSSEPSLVPVKDGRETATRPRKDTFGSLDFNSINGLVHAPVKTDDQQPASLGSVAPILTRAPVEYSSLVTPATPRTEEFTDPVPVEYRPVVSPAPDAARPASGNWFKVGAENSGPMDLGEQTIELSSPDLEADGRPPSGSWFVTPGDSRRLPPLSPAEETMEDQTRSRNITTPGGFPSSQTDTPNTSLSPTALLQGLRRSPRRALADDAGSLRSTEMVAQASSEGHMPSELSEPTEPVPVRMWNDQPFTEAAKAARIGTWPLQQDSPPLRGETPEVTDNEDDRPSHQLRSAVTPVDWPVMQAMSTTSSVPPSVVDETPTPSVAASPPSATLQFQELGEGIAEDDVEEVISFGSGPRMAPRSFTITARERPATPDSDDDVFISPPMAPYLSDSAPETPSEYMTPFEVPSTATSEAFATDESTATDDAVTANEGSSDGFSLQDALASLPNTWDASSRFPRSPIEPSRASSTTPRTARAPLTEFPFPPSPACSSHSSVAPSIAQDLINGSTPEPATPVQPVLSPRKLPLPQSPVEEACSPSRPAPPSVDTLLARMDQGTSEPSPTDPLVVTPGVNDFAYRSRSVSPVKESRLETPPRFASVKTFVDSPTDAIGLVPRKSWSPLGVPGRSPEQEPAVADASFTLPLSTSTTAEDLAGEASKADKATQDTIDALEELVSQETQTEEHIREQEGAPAPTRLTSSTTQAQTGLSDDMLDLLSITSSPPVRITDLCDDSLEEDHFATAPITSSLGEQLHSAEAEQSLAIPRSQDALPSHLQTVAAAGSSTKKIPDAIIPLRDTSHYSPYGYPYGSRMGMSAVSLSIEEPPHSATTSSSRSSATFGLEYLRRSMDWSVDDDSPYSYQRSLPNASKDSILLSSSPVRSPRALSATSPTGERLSLPPGVSPLRPAPSVLGSPASIGLGLGSPLHQDVRLEAPSPATQSLALAGAPLPVSTLLLPSLTALPPSPGGSSARGTPSPTETESRTISRLDTPIRDIVTPVDSEVSPSRRLTVLPLRRDAVISPASRALMIATGSTDFLPETESSSPVDTVRSPPTPRKRYSTPIRALTSPDSGIPSPSTTETGTTETGTTETIRAAKSPVAAASLAKPVSRAASTSKPRPPPLRPTFFAPPPLNSDGSLLVVGSQHFNETLEQVSASLGTALQLSSDGLYIQAPAHDLFLISDHIKMMRSLLGDMHRPSSRSLHGPKSPALAPPPPPPPPPPFSQSPRLGSPLLGSPILTSPGLGPDSPPSVRVNISPDTLAKAAAAAALKRASSPDRMNLTTPPKSPVLQSLAEAVAAKALQHGAFSPSLRPTSPISPNRSPNAEDPWKAARQKMRHVDVSPERLPSALPTLAGTPPTIPGPTLLRRTDGGGDGRRRRQVEEMRRRDREEGALFRKANKHEKMPPLPIAPRALRPVRAADKPGRAPIPAEYKSRSRSSSGAVSVAASTSPSALPLPILSSPPAEVRPQIDAVYERLRQTSMGSRYPRTAFARERAHGSRDSPSSSISSRIELSALSPPSASSAVPSSARVTKELPQRRGSNSSSGHSTPSGSSFRVQRKPIPRESSDSSRDTKNTSFTSGNTSYSKDSSVVSRDTGMLSNVKESPREKEARSHVPTPLTIVPRAPAAPSRLPHISSLPHHALPTATNAFEIPGTFADDVKAIMSQSPRTPTSASSSGPKGLARIKPPKSYRFKFGRSGGSVE